MSYCAPYWISDYTYSGIAQRMAFTNNTQARVIGVPRIVQTLIVDDDGQVMLGGALRVRQAPGGVPVDVLLQDARGKVGEVRSVPMQLLDHKRGGFIYLDALPPWVASVSYMGQAIPL